ncbi:MAG: class I SAM-dependent methyltransferase [Proteobacteria bacterium]|nr:class I SAM-dependent methyltransferase [Pseudomonadota bacterium]
MRTFLKSLVRDHAPPGVMRGLFAVADAGRSAAGRLGLPLVSTDWVGYEGLVEFITRHHILSVPGDLLEIGAFLGGGTKKLCDLLAREQDEKTLWVVDAFDPGLDHTENRSGRTMAGLYASALKGFPGQTQWEVFSRATAGCGNLRVIRGDSREVFLPPKRLCFAFLDGHHAPESVARDFSLAWERLSPGGALAVHDYGGDLPQVTATLDRLLNSQASRVKTLLWDRRRWVLYAIKS